jgi:phospholipid/cholesterol/gamma-HCH transport system substrate-binding protein
VLNQTASGAGHPQAFADTGFEGSIVPSRKEIQWSQLKVGILVLVAVAVLIGLVFLMSGSTGGLFTRKLTLRSYFHNASGLKGGAPVSLEGVTIGNVTRIHIVPARNPTPVEVTMQVGEKAAIGLHTDSMTSIAQAGVLGDSYVDITSETATGPPPANNAELAARNVPSIQAVVDTSQEALQKATVVMGKVNVLLDTLNSKRGTAGMFLNDPQVYNKTVALLNNAEEITRSISQGKGTLGKLLTDETMYNKLNETVDRLNTISESLAEGHGSAGKLLHDETLYNNLNAAVENTNKLLEGINSGKGALGKFTQDQEFAKKLDDTVTSLDTLLNGINEGKGTLGQFAQNRSLFDHADQTMDQAQQLVKAIRENPKKYLVIHLKLF